MHTVVKTPAYLAAAEDAGMTDAEREKVVETVAKNPMAGVSLSGTGGCRKIRVAGRGKGKSGGYRVITFYTGLALPVYLLTVFSKGDRADLAKAERNALARTAGRIAALYERKGKT